MFIFYKAKKNGGFTFIEVLIVLMIFSSLAFFSLPVYSHFFTKTNSHSDLLKIENLLKRTRQKSFSSFNNSSFGVFLDKDNHSFVFYEGDSFLDRNEDGDIVFEYEESLELISPTEDTNVNFLRGEGRPNNEVVFLFSTKKAEEKSIIINKFGAIFIE